MVSAAFKQDEFNAKLNELLAPLREIDVAGSHPEGITDKHFHLLEMLRLTLYSNKYEETLDHFNSIYSPKDDAGNIRKKSITERVDGKAVKREVDDLYIDCSVKSFELYMSRKRSALKKEGLYSKTLYQNAHRIYAEVFSDERLPEGVVFNPETYIEKVISETKRRAAEGNVKDKQKVQKLLESAINEITAKDMINELIKSNVVSFSQRKVNTQKNTETDMAAKPEKATEQQATREVDGLDDEAEDVPQLPDE